VGRITRVHVLVLVGVMAAAVALAVRARGWLNGLERITVDARFSVRGSEPAPPGIAIVAIDQNTIGQLKSFPFSRTLYVPVIRRLQADGAHLIAFDIEFDTRSTPAADNALMDAVAAAGPMVFATTVVHTDGTTPVFGGPLTQQQIGAVVGVTLVAPDNLGTIRRVPYSVLGVPGFAVAADTVAGGGQPPPRTPFANGGALIDYRGPAGTFPAYSFVDVSAGRVRPSAFRGKIIIIGETAPSGQDFRPSPFGEMSGAEVEANGISTIRSGFPLQDAPGALDVALIVALALLAPAVALRWGPLTTLGAAALGFLTLSVGAQVAFNSGTVVDYTDALLALTLSAAATIGVGYVVANRERSRLRELFAAFTPEVVDQVLADSGAQGRLIGPALPATGVIGGYRMEEVIGRSAMGVVYKATQLELDRPVAIKVISPQHAANRRFRERFERESKLAASVEHANVIPVYGAGDDDGLLYIAMRYVDGVDLGALVSRTGPIEPRRAAAIVGEVAGALDAADAHGLVHRDVKPANILLTLDEPEHAYLTDFGVAKTTAVTDETALTRPGKFVGTIDYIAPEQFRVQPVDGRADMYSLGCVLYELITGAVPYPLENDLAKLYAHANAPPPAPSDRDPGLAAFDPVIARAMAKQPEDRFATCGALAEAALVAAQAAAALATTQRSR
jgi:CHASE2 domain-containing sensor protein